MKEGWRHTTELLLNESFINAGAIILNTGITILSGSFLYDGISSGNPIPVSLAVLIAGADILGLGTYMGYKATQKIAFLDHTEVELYKAQAELRRIKEISEST